MFYLNRFSNAIKKFLEISRKAINQGESKMFGSVLPLVKKTNSSGK